MKEILPQVAEAAISLLGLILTLVIAKVSAAVQAKLKSDRAAAFVQRASDQARDVVLELEQTLVQGMRKASEDGRLDRDDVAFLQEEALKRLKEHLGPKGVSEGLQVLGFRDIADLERVLRAKIEAEIHLLPKAFVPVSSNVIGGSVEVRQG